MIALATYAISMMFNLMLFQGQPNLLELRTTGAAGEYQWDMFGLYKLLPEVTGDGGSPVYRQMHDGDNAEYFLYRWDPCCIQCTGNGNDDPFYSFCPFLQLIIRADGFWWVNEELGKKGGWLRAKVETEEDKKMPPVQGWQYHAGDGKSQSDPTLEVSRQVSKPCSEVLVELHGAAKEEWPECAGIYKPLKEWHNRGRWVGSFFIIDNQSKGIGTIIKKRIS